MKVGQKVKIKMPYGGIAWGIITDYGNHYSDFQVRVMEGYFQGVLIRINKQDIDNENLH